MKQINNAVKEIIELLQSSLLKNEKSKTLWTALKEQSKQEGTWDQDLIDAIEKKIMKYLGSLEEEDLRVMWETTEKGMDSFDDRDDIPLKNIKTDLVDEFMNLVMDKLDTSGSYESEISDSRFVDDEEDFEDDFTIDAADDFDDDFLDDEKF